MKTILTTAVLTTFLALTGCQSDKGGHEHGDHKHGHHDHDHGSGKAKSTDIAQKDVPAAVMKGFNGAYPGATISQVEKEVYPDGTVHYEFDFKTADGKKMEIELNDEGEVLEGH
ncbi:MAG TPA: hypothetical protein VGB55_13750 [Tepidisphaeraceae bacterium]